MSTRELQRVEIFSRVQSEKFPLRDAAEMLMLSYRQTKRLWRRYRQEGAAGLQHRSASRSSHRAKPRAFREQVLRLIREKYSGGAEEPRFGPTLAAEHLAEEDGLHLDAETLRRWMLEEGLWMRTRGRKPAHLHRRPRKEHFGELVQLDGSFHAWYEQRGPHGCLMNMVDDATSTTHARLGAAETIWAAARVLRAWIERYGIPLALYTDWKNVYKVAPTPKQELSGEEPLTQFGRMCARLGIRIVGAHSPQAKGRVERNNGVHQDRLVKKFRRQGIHEDAAANAYMESHYLPALNRRFAKKPAQPQDYHRPCPSRAELDHAFRLETERWVSNDWVVRHHHRYLQLQPTRHQRRSPGVKALIYESEEGALEVCYRGETMAFSELAEPPRATEPEQEATVHVRCWQPRYRPGPGHPFKRNASQQIKRVRKRLLGKAVAARRA
ncbi:MAG TPA: ISNCY family transposase, partial [Candidatus Acidoferrum sp.]